MTYYETFSQLENHYLNDEFREAIDIYETNGNDCLIDINQNKYDEIIEIVTVSYIELNKLSVAKKMIIAHLRYLQANNRSQDNIDDIITFLELKSEVYYKQGFYFRLLRLLKNNEMVWSSREDRIELINEAEEKLYSRYILINKVLFFLAILLVVGSLIKFPVFDNPILTTISTIIISWYVLHYLFHKTVRKIFSKVIS